ncbi:MAG: hypothetical protein K2L76_04490 [Muribaculaceae bacterium]|nr:hypothetical protein [Muribaculaceae bacterium]
MKKFLTLFALVAIALFGFRAAAQLVTTSPDVLRDDSQDVVLYFHADSPEGNAALRNYTGDVYAHIGVTTGNGTWQYVVAEWNENVDKCKLTRIDANNYSLAIGDIRTFFGIDPADKVMQLCMVFRSADGTKECKTAAGGDIFVAIEHDGPVSEAREYPGGVPVQGAVDNADGTVTFCLAAPDKSSVTIVPSWSDYKLLDENCMYYHDYNGRRYFWITSPKLADDTDYMYYYLVDGIYAVGDPYAKLVLDPYNDKWLLADGLGYEGMPEYPAGVGRDVMLAVWRRDMNSYNWSAFEIPAHDRLYVYEMLLRDFTGTEGQSKGNGTLAAAMEKIPYIKSLGVNAVELMPVMEFNGNNSWGYNTNFYMAPDKAYGSPEQYKDFIDECHRNGMAVILDIVFNQTDGLTPWYQMYPVGANPFYNAKAPHDYSVLNDLNPGYDLVEQHYIDVLQYWLREYNVDGFRFDLVKGLGDNSSYGSGTEAYNQSRVDRMKRLHAAIKAVKPDAIHINELLAASPEENANAADGQIGWHNLSHNAGQFAMSYDEDNSGVSEFYTANTDRTPWHSMAYAESHDEERLGYKMVSYAPTAVQTGRVRARRLAALGAWMVLTPGPKMIWQFQEMGNDQTTKNSDGSNNTSPKRVNWSALDNAINKHIVAAYRAAGALRVANPAMFGRDADFVCTWSKSTTAPRSLCIRKDGKTIVAFFNPSTTAAQDVTVSGTGLAASAAELVYACEGFDNPSLSGSGGTLKLNVPANSFAIYGSAGISGIDDAVADGIDGSVSVAGGIGEIIVSGACGAVEAYDLSGRRVALSGLAAGVYVVRVDGGSYKVAVR